MAPAITGSFFFTSVRNLWRNLVLFTVLPVFLLLIIKVTNATAVFGGGDTGEETSADRLDTVRNGYADQAGSAINVDMIDTSTPLGMIAWIPIGVSYFYLAPIPFLGTSIISLATSPEMLVWYFLLPSVFRGLSFALRHRLRLIAPIMLYALISTVGWSLVVTNVGTLYRYRSQVLFFALIMAACDHVRRREGAKEKQAQFIAALSALRKMRFADSIEKSSSAGPDECPGGAPADGCLPAKQAQ